VRLVDGTLDVVTFVTGFGFDHAHKYSQRWRRGSGQLTRCFCVVAEPLVGVVV